MNILWLIILFISIIYALFSGNIAIANDVFLKVGKDTWDFVIPLLCVTCFWNGMLFIAKDSGIIKALQKLFHPLLKRLFPDVKNDHETLGLIATNILVNMIGLGSAATPAGLKAMQGLQKHNANKKIASRAMVTFLVLNTAGVTLISTTIIALRTTFNSKDVAGFMPFAVIATMFASLIGLAVDRWWNYRD